MASFAIFFGSLARKFNQPAILGELIGGIVLGPTVVGYIFPDMHHYFFESSKNALIAREGVVKLGLLFFLFVAGMEINVDQLRGKGRSVFFTSLLGIFIPFTLGFGAVYFMPDLWPHTDASIIVLAVFLGTALSITALPVILKILMDLKLLNERIGTIVMASAIIDDLIGWMLFAFILNQVAPVDGVAKSFASSVSSVALMFLFVFTLGRWAGKRFLTYLDRNALWPSGFIALTSILVLFAAAFSEMIGVHAIFGAFFAGVVLNRSNYERAEEHHAMHQFVAVFFGAPIYFVSIGLKVNFIQFFNPGLVLFVFLIACTGKLIGATLGARLSRLTVRESLAVGFGMNARGAMEIVLATLALEHGLIHEDLFVALVIMAIGTSMLSAPMIKWVLGKNKPAVS